MKGDSPKMLLGYRVEFYKDNKKRGVFCKDKAQALKLSIDLRRLGYEPEIVKVYKKNK